MTEPQAYTIKPLVWARFVKRENGWIAWSPAATYRVWNTLLWACSVNDGPLGCT